jgi:hypothetical protein
VYIYKAAGVFLQIAIVRRFKYTLRLSTYILTIIFLVTFFSCNSRRKGYEISDTNKPKQSNNIIHCVDADDESKNCNCPAQFNLSDSNQLTHIKNEFYKSNIGHLYERTIGVKEVNGHLTDYEYFNGHFSQEVDPLSFEALEGWYARDKNYVYYYRPASSGMQISRIDTADTQTFKLLAGHYKYGVDKNFFYDEPEIIQGFLQSKSKLKFDNKGRVTEMTCNNKTYKFELVDKSERTITKASLGAKHQQ